MAARALDDQEERHLVLDYLLGVPIAVIARHYEITRPTVYRILERHEIETERKSKP